MGQVAAKTTHDRSGYVQTEATGLRASLKGTEKVFRRSDACAGVFESNYELPILLAGSDPKPLCLCGRHGSLAVFGEVQENLNESVPVGPRKEQLRYSRSEQPRTDSPFF